MPDVIREAKREGVDFFKKSDSGKEKNFFENIRVKIAKLTKEPKASARASDLTCKGFMSKSARMMLKQTVIRLDIIGNFDSLKE